MREWEWGVSIDYNNSYLLVYEWESERMREWESERIREWEWERSIYRL